MINKINSFERLKEIYNQNFQELKKENISVNTIKKYDEIIESLLENVNLNSLDESYQSFEFLTIKVSNIGFYNNKIEKQNLLHKIYNKFKSIFTNDYIQDKYLTFVKQIFLENKYPYYDLEESVLNILNEIINMNNCHEKIISYLKQILKQKESDELAIYLLKLIKKYHSEKETISESEHYLYSPKICDYLLNYYQNDPTKTKEILIKIIENKNQ